MRTLVSVLAYLAGAVLVVCGFWMLWEPLGVIVAGGLLAGLGFALDPSGGE
jgi:hypothetical protein